MRSGQQRIRRGSGEAFSLLVVSFRRSLLVRDDLSYRAVRLSEGGVSNAADVRLTHLIDPVYLSEEFSPITEPHLVYSELLCESFVVCEPPDEVGFGACFHHL